MKHTYTHSLLARYVESSRALKISQERVITRHMTRQEMRFHKRQARKYDVFTRIHDDIPVKSYMTGDKTRYLLRLST